MSEPTAQKKGSLRKPFITVVSLTALWFVWKADVFWHYYQFKQLCAAEGGLKVYEKLEKGRGWKYDLKGSDSDTLRPYVRAMPSIGFFRLKRTELEPLPELGVGALIDLYYVGGERRLRSAYAVRAADFSQPVRYQLVTDVNRINNGRASHFWFEVRDAETQKALIRYTQFIFHWRSIPVWHWLGPSGQSGCPMPEPVGNTDFALINQMAFKE